MAPAPPPDAVHPPQAVAELRGRGVRIPAPEQVAIGADVRLERIAPGAVIHPFARITGPDTRIGPGAEIGPGGPATLRDAWVGAGAVVGSLGPVTLLDATCGPGTVLGAGVAEGAVFLGREGGAAGATTGYGFRAREGSLYEEGAGSAQHTDTKMTVLFPWVTLGSNINWCDVLVSGGAGPEDFSEVGSGTIHFNFTPRGHKATASAFGDVVRGVFLRQPRLFLGGNGAMIGPLRASFGAITVAGGRYAGALEPGLNGGEAAPDARDFDAEIHGSVKRVVDSQVAFIAELAALDAWYTQVRALLAGSDAELKEVYARGRMIVAANIAERIAQLGRLAGAMERSAAKLEAARPGDPRVAQQRALLEAWPRMEAALSAHAGLQEEMPAQLRAGLEAGAAKADTAYTRVVRGLPDEAVAAGESWLGAIRERVAAPELLALVPSLE